MKKNVKRILLVIVGIIIVYNIIMFIKFNLIYKKLNTYYSPDKQFSIITYVKPVGFLDAGDAIIKYNSSFNTISYIDAGNYEDIIAYSVNVEWEDSKAYVHYAYNKCIIFDLHKKPSKIDDLQEYYVTQIDTDNEEEKIQILYDYKGNEIHRTTADEIELIKDKKNGKLKYYADNWYDSDGVYSMLYTIDGKKLNTPFNDSILFVFDNYIVFQNEESKATIYEINNDDFNSKNIVYDDIRVVGSYIFASNYVYYGSNSSKLDIYDEKLNKIKTVDSYVFDKVINHFYAYYKLKYKKGNIIKYNLLDPRFNVIFEYPVNYMDIEEYGNDPFNNPYTFETDYSYIKFDFLNNEIKSEEIKDGYDINNFKKYNFDNSLEIIQFDDGIVKIAIDNMGKYVLLDCFNKPISDSFDEEIIIPVSGRKGKKTDLIFKTIENYENEKEIAKYYSINKYLGKSDVNQNTTFCCCGCGFYIIENDKKLFIHNVQNNDKEYVLSLENNKYDTETFRIQDKSYLKFYDQTTSKQLYLFDENLNSINVDLGNKHLTKNNGDYLFFVDDKKITVYDHNLKIIKEISENFKKSTNDVRRYKIKNKVYYFVFAGPNRYSTYIDIYDESFNFVLGNITFLSIYKDYGKFLYDKDSFLDYMIVSNKEDEAYAVYNSNFEKVYEFENAGECEIFNLDNRKYYCIKYKDKNGISKCDIYKIINNDLKLILSDIEGIVLFDCTCLIKKDGKLKFCDFSLHMDEIDISNIKMEFFINKKYDTSKYYVITNSQNKSGVISQINGKIIANCIYDTVVLYDTYFVTTLNNKKTIFSYTGDVIFENNM